MVDPPDGDAIVTLGCVLSKLIVTEAVFVLPALSTTVPLTSWFLPSPDTGTGVGQEETPLKLSEQAKVTVTLELFQPAAFAGGLAEAETAGAVLSIFTVPDVVALNPALFTAVPVAPWFAPSLVNETGELQEAIPRMKSAQLKVIVAFELFQPAAVGAGDTVAMIVGGTAKLRS
jgi:hypothetical protein